MHREEPSFQLLPFGLPGHSKVALSLLQCDDPLVDLDQVEGLRRSRRAPQSEGINAVGEGIAALKEARAVLTAK
jgi:hypothetical protein